MALTTEKHYNNYGDSNGQWSYQYRTAHTFFAKVTRPGSKHITDNWGITSIF